MKRRGRPAYPDILTPRQREVLALLREGLTNPQIAERLGISLDGAKFLVGEVISRLGVADRTEAARWQPAAAAPAAAPRLAWALAPFVLLRKITPSWLPPAASGTILVAALAGVGVLTWAVVSTGGGGARVLAPTATANPVSVSIGAADSNQFIFTTRAPDATGGNINDVVVGVYDTTSHTLVRSFKLGNGTEAGPVQVVAAGDKLVANLTTRIVRYDIDGTNSMELRHAPACGRFIGIGASPDGQIIAFTEQTSGLFPPPASCVPSPAPPSPTPAFAPPYSSVTEINVLKTATGEQVMTVPQSDPRFAQYVGQAANPVWRSDGKGFAVTAYTYSEYSGSIATVMLDGTVHLYLGGGYLISPDAQYIEAGAEDLVCWLGGTAVRHAIQVRRLTDSSMAREFSDPVLNLTPVEWSPDESQLLYSTAILVPGSPDPNCVVEDPASVKWHILDLNRAADPTPVSGSDDARTRWYGSRSIQYRCHGEVVLRPYCSTPTGGEAPVDTFVGDALVGSGIDWRIVQLIPAG